MNRQEKNIIIFLLFLLFIGLLVRAYNLNKKPSLPHSLPSTFSRINPNTATETQLNNLPGIGPVISQRIVCYRMSNPPFLKPSDLLNIKGIGPKKLEKIKPHIVFNAVKLIK